VRKPKQEDAFERPPRQIEDGLSGQGAEDAAPSEPRREHVPGEEDENSKRSSVSIPAPPD